MALPREVSTTEHGIELVCDITLHWPITAAINEELKHKPFIWHYAQTLSHTLPLPNALASAGAVSLTAVDGKVKSTEGTLGLAVRFDAQIHPRTQPDSSKNPSSAAPAEARR